MAQVQAKEQAQQAAGQAQEQVKQQAGQAKERAREQVDQRSTQAGAKVSEAAGDARSVADELRKQGKDAPARYAEQAADRAERLGGYLQESDADRILRDVEDLGRKQPWAVIVGGLALGFAASRFLKASSTERYHESTSRPRGLPSPNGAPDSSRTSPPEASFTRPGATTPQQGL